MNRDRFMDLAQKRLDFCMMTLDKKREEYGPGDDRLEQFWKAAKLMSCVRVTDALMGMMVKN